ncbi:hypothetical protein HNR46_003664 [Haloferula luteola]|uniref:Uncharacterized protein n=1 Tax=Haloferula luteola TaxID=595692 RepID=A0A840V574_9BACT|nr:hypothetical protein [Haloferula luteola]MBB5353407.1 hypothetical protein [Haloferula luteola]
MKPIVQNNAQSESHTQRSTEFFLLKHPKPEPICTTLLGCFDVFELGRGDEGAGLNTLVSLCAVLSNLGGPDACIKQGNHELDAHLDWVVAGDQSTRQLRIMALDKLSRRQAIWLRKAELLRAQDQDVRKWESGKAYGARTKGDEMEKLVELIGRGECHSPLDEESAFKQLLFNARSPVKVFQEQPHVYFEGTASKSFERLLERCHLGHAFVSLTPTSIAHSEETLSVYQAISGGRQLESGAIIRGNAVTIMPMSLAKSLIEDERHFGPDVLLLSDVPWEPMRSFSRSQNKISPPMIEVHFEGALERILVARFEQSPWVSRAMNVSWRDELEHLRLWVNSRSGPGDESWPLTMRLFGSLGFGLSLLTEQGGRFLPKVEGSAVGSLTRFVIQRSIFAKQWIAMRDHETDLRRIAASMVSKLNSQPQTSRDLARRFNDLRIVDCRKILRGLISTGHVKCSGDVDSPDSTFTLIEHRG